MRRPHMLGLLFCLVPALALLALAADMIWGGGHPPLGAVLVSWAIYPTLTGYLSRAFLRSDYPPPFVMLLGFVEYPFVGFGLGAIIALSKVRTDRLARVGAIAFLSYISAQVATHILLNLQTVNLRLASNASPAVSEAAIDRLRESGDSAALPTLQHKLLGEIERQGFPGDNLLDALTQLGGARGWQDLLETRRLGVAGRDARNWRFIINNVREMSSPYYAASRGGIRSPYFREEDIARLFEALAAKVAERLESTADNEAALTLLSLMKGRFDLCSRYLAIVPSGLGDRFSQATYELTGNLAAIRNGHPPDSIYNYQTFLSKDEIVRIGREQTTVAREWSAWAQSDASPCRAR